MTELTPADDDSKSGIISGWLPPKVVFRRRVEEGGVFRVDLIAKQRPGLHEWNAQPRRIIPWKPRQNQPKTMLSCRCTPRAQKTTRLPQTRCSVTRELCQPNLLPTCDAVDQGSTEHSRTARTFYHAGVFNGCPAASRPSRVSRCRGASRLT